MSSARSTQPRGLLVAVLGGAALALALAPARASAQEELRLMNEPTSFTDVIDAFDEGDAFDLNVHVGFRRSRVAGTIQREVNDAGAASGRAADGFRDVGDWEHVRNVLELGVDVGLFRDVALFGRLPLVLRDEREVLRSGSAAEVDPLLVERTPGAAGDPQLFYLPYQSATRSGVSTVELGLAANLFNQGRRPSFPTWMMLFALELGIGDIMTPCTDGGVVQRDPGTGEPLVDAMGDPVPNQDCDGGVSEGTHAFRFESRLSRRYRHAEVYSGLMFRFPWAGRAEDAFSPAGSLAGYQNTRPPIRGSLSAGVALVPWENRETWQRFSVDLRGKATYVSEGRDYSPLFDALGTSQSPYLTDTQPEGYDASGNQVGRQVAFNGLTDVQAHGEIGGTLAVEMQAARYVRFRFGANVMYVTPHLLTATDGRNPNASPEGDDDPRAGSCTEGLLNPAHRPVIDTPGQRFRLDGAVSFDLFVQAAAQF